MCWPRSIAPSPSSRRTAWSAAFCSTRRARDLVGFTFLQFVFHLPVVLLLLWLLGMTFEFVPPVMP